MLKRTILAALAVVSLSIFSPRQSYALPILSLGASIPNPDQNTFVVPINVTGAVNLASWQFDLFFNKNVVKINDTCDPTTDSFCDTLFGPVTEGPFFKSVAIFPTLFVPGFIDNTNGQLLGVAGAWQDPGPGPSGDGILAYVEFTRLVPGSDVSPGIRLGDNSTTTNSVPEPTSILLLTGGLALLRARRSTRRNGQLER